MGVSGHEMAGFILDENSGIVAVEPEAAAPVIIVTHFTKENHA
jgi:hypothetical protein